MIVTVVAGQELAFNPVLIPPASITGTVTDRSGATLGGLEVILFRPRSTRRSPRRAPPPTPQGGYRFADVDAPQAYVVEVRSPTTGALGSATLVLAASEAAVLDITVGPQVPTSTASPPRPLRRRRRRIRARRRRPRRRPAETAGRSTGHRAVGREPRDRASTRPHRRSASPR